MIVVSNHLFNTTNINMPYGTVVRVNLAWIKSKEEARKLLDELEFDVYLDYPQGRTKPPKPVITIEQAIDLANVCGNVKYFAVSNTEDSQSLNYIKSQLVNVIQIVPKIETITGVRNLDVIFQNVLIKFVMLDKEDLYLDVNKDSKLYEELVDTVRQKCKDNKIELLELQGVVFG